MSFRMRYTNRWEIGDWDFVEVVDHGFSGDLERLFGYRARVPKTASDGRVHEWYATLEHAMAAAIAEKYTGRRGAGGTGVGTAADWFMRMIGAERTGDEKEGAT